MYYNCYALIDVNSLREILPYEVKERYGTVLNNPHFIVNCQHTPELPFPNRSQVTL